MQRGGGLPNLVAAEIRPKRATPAWFEQVVHHRDAGQRRLIVHTNEDRYLSARRPVPGRQVAHEQVALEPRRLVLGVAGERLDPLDTLNHPLEVGAIPDVRPVRANAAAQPSGSSDVE